MKFICALLFLAAAAMAFPAEITVKYIPVLERTEKHDERGQYALRYITGDGTTVNEAGALVPTNDGKDYVLAKQGSYEWTVDGQTFRTEYVADKNGYRATGAHLPKSVVA